MEATDLSQLERVVKTERADGKSSKYQLSKDPVVFWSILENQCFSLEKSSGGCRES